MTCPICGTRKRFTDIGATMYDCGTWIETNGYKSQGDACVLIHYPKLKARAERLEKAGELVLKLDSNLEWAEAERVWEEAKASK